MKLKIILASIRKNRLGGRVAKWATTELDKNDIVYELIDLKDYNLPFLDSDTVPFDLNKKYPYDIVQYWSNKIDEGDAYIIITCEYNRGYPATLKNAIDWLGMELWGKPVAFISYSDGPFGGVRCIEQLRSVISNFNMYGIRNAISIGKANDIISTEGKNSVKAFDVQLKKMVDELALLSSKLK